MKLLTLAADLLILSPIEWVFVLLANACLTVANAAVTINKWIYRDHPDEIDPEDTI